VATKDLTIIFYTDNNLEETFAKRVQKELIKATEGKRIVSVSQKPMNFGDNIPVGDIGRSHHSLFYQTMVGASAATTKYMALAEHDCFYTPEHFNWTPPDSQYFYYNVNHWYVQWNNGRSGEYSYQRRKVMSMLICDRELYLRAIAEKILMLETGFEIRKGQPGACEPGVCDDRAAFVEAKEKWIEKTYLDKCKENPGHKDVGKETFSARAFRTVLPNLDIRHGMNFSGGRRARETAMTLPYWGNFKDYMGAIK
jgi:hypothetical protein